jgi:hypothetical protein
MTDYLPAQAGDEDDAGNGSDDDVRIGTHTQVFSDPIALTPFVDAVVVYVPLTLASYVREPAKPAQELVQSAACA